MEIKKITDPAFRKYGRLVTNVDFTELIEALKEHTSIPEGVAYEPFQNGTTFFGSGQICDP